MQKVLEGARSALIVPDELIETAAIYALLFAKAGGRGKWIDYAVELYLRTLRPMSQRVVDALEDALGYVPAIDTRLYRHYLELMRSISSGMRRHELEILNRLVALNLPGATRPR